MKKILVLLLSIGVLTAVMFSTACKKDNVVRIGAIVPLSGVLAPIGKDIQCAIEIAKMHINAEGGVKGKKVEVYYEDSMGLPEKGKEAYEKLVKEKHVSVIVGPCSSEVALAVAPLAEKYKVPFVSPTASTPKLTTKGNDYTFRVYPSDTIEAKKLADVMFNKMLIRSIVVVAVKNEYGYGVSNEILRIARNTADMDVKDVIRYSPDAIYDDFVKIAKKIKELNPEAIVMCSYPDDAKMLLKALAEEKVDAFKFASSSIGRPDFIKSLGDIAVGLVYAKAQFDPKSTRDDIKRFVKDFIDRCGKEPDVYAAHGYDALKVAAYANEKSPRSDDVLRRLQQTKGYKGVGGDITFDRFGDVVKFPKIFVVRKDENGNIYCTKITDEDINKVKDAILNKK